MSKNQKTRSTLTIDAVAQAAATGVANALNPLKKLEVIAGLAGFVLRLFRSQEQFPPIVGEPEAGLPADGSGKEVDRMQKGSRKEVRSNPARTADRKGGLRHG